MIFERKMCELYTESADFLRMLFDGSNSEFTKVDDEIPLEGGERYRGKRRDRESKREAEKRKRAAVNTQKS